MSDLPVYKTMKDTVDALRIRTPSGGVPQRFREAVVEGDISRLHVGSRYWPEFRAAAIWVEKNRKRLESRGRDLTPPTPNHVLLVEMCRKVGLVDRNDRIAQGILADIEAGKLRAFRDDSSPLNPYWVLPDNFYEYLSFARNS